MCQRAHWVLLVSAFFAPTFAVAQIGDPIRLYGYFQGNFRYNNENAQGVLNGDIDFASFSLQQLNVLMAKDFTSSFSALSILSSPTASPRKTAGGISGSRKLGYNIGTALACAFM